MDKEVEEEEMTREQKIEAYTMRIDGYTYQEIADSFGVTRQNIHSLLENCLNSNPGRVVSRTKYLGLKNWMMENRCFASNLAKIVRPNTKNTSWISAKLTGSIEFTMSEINKIIEITGLTYEELFTEV